MSDILSTDPIGSDDGSPHVTDEPGRAHYQNQDVKIGWLAKSSGGEAKGNIKSWKREDRCRRRHVMTAATGPSWSSVTRRTVYDLDTDELIEDIQVDADISEDQYQYDISVS